MKSGNDKTAIIIAVTVIALLLCCCVAAFFIVFLGGFSMFGITSGAVTVVP
jgi:hypothetical protein